MTTAADVYARMMREAPSDMGFAFPIDSGTATTVVIAQLANSGYSASYFDDWYLIRPQAGSTADRVRVITDFTASSGTFTVATMSDTTFTSETAIISRVHPMLLSDALQHALRRSRKLHTLVLPAEAGIDNWLRDASWVEQPSDVLGIGWSTSPVLTNNRNMEDWNVYDSSGNLLPDYWTLTGSGATMARSDLETALGIASRSRYGLSITRSSNDCSISQRIPLRVTGVSGDSLAGETITAVARVWADAASRARVRVTDGVETTNSDYHTGGSTFEELTAEHTVNAAATYLEIQVRLETGDDTIYVDEAYGHFGTLDDTVRRGNYRWLPVWNQTYNQSGSTLPVRLPPRQQGSTYRIHTLRPYPALDSTRLGSGAADPDTIDAPEDLIAYGALANLYDRLSGEDDRDTSTEARLRFKYEREYAYRAKLHQYFPRSRIPSPPLAVAPASRW